MDSGTGRLEADPWRQISLRRSVAAILLVSLLPAVCDAVVSLSTVSRHLEYYIDAVIAGALIVAFGGAALGAAGFAGSRLTPIAATSRQLAACAYGAASAVAAVLAVPRSIGFDRSLIQLAFVALPFVAFSSAAALRWVCSRHAHVRVVLTALAPSAAYLTWLLLAKPTLAAPREDRLISIGLFLLLYLIATALAVLVERTIPRRSPEPRAWIEITPYLALGIILIFWAGVREPLFSDVRARSPHESPDVLLIVLDTARSDLYSIGSPRIELPTLAKLSESSRVYTSAFATSCWTLPAHASMFTGVPASATGALTGPLSPSIPTLAQEFRRAGYATAAFSGNPLIGPSSGLDRGFRHFENFLPGEELRGRDHVWLNAVVTSRSSKTQRLWHLRDDGGAIMVSRTLDYLDKSEQPVFVFLNLFEPHDPYAPPYLPDEWATWNGFSPAELRTMKGAPYDELGAWPPPAGAERYFAAMRLRYKGELWYVDHLLGKLFQRLESSGRLDDTVIVVVSDHGENIGEHFPSLTHTLGLYDTLTHVPLVIRYPPEVSPGHDDRLLSTARIHDMLLSLSGHGDTDFAALDEGTTEAVFSEFIPPPGLMKMIEAIAGRKLPEYDRSLRSVRTDSMRWVEASDLNHQAFDLRSDPFEQNNLVSAPGTIPPGFESLSSMLAQRPQLSTDTQRIPEELEQSLRALGYHQ